MTHCICGHTSTGDNRNNANSILATHVGGFWDPLAGRDPQFEKPCCEGQTDL